MRSFFPKGPNVSTSLSRTARLSVSAVAAAAVDGILLRARRGLTPHARELIASPAMRLRPIVLLLLAVFVTGGAPAHALTILTHGKVLKLVGRGDPDPVGQRRGLVRFGPDPALAGALDPSCPLPSSFELGVYPAATNRVVRSERVMLDCAKWRAREGGWVYTDPAAPGAVRKIRYGPAGLVVKLAGADALPAPGPLGYAFVWFTVGDRRYHGRFHVFRTNREARIVGRKPSRAAAEGEAGFWAVMLADDRSEERQQATLDALGRAARRTRSDGRSRFLTAMLRLYRFGQLTESITDAGPDARAELEAAVAAFDAAEPLLWDRAAGRGDSRVPGFSAAARYALGVVAGDAELRQRGINDLAYAIQINPFFNVFDLITVAQAEPAGSAAFQKAFVAMDTYLSNPETLTCLGDQPEICGNEGLAPSGFQGALVLFGDLYAKAGDADRAEFWYTLAAGTETGWPFAPLGADRLATVDARVAAYRDEEPANDPPIIGARQEACAVCHNRFVAAP
jgi:hypothetical protein